MFWGFDEGWAPDLVCVSGCQRFPPQVSSDHDLKHQCQGAACGACPRGTRGPRLRLGSFCRPKLVAASPGMRCGSTAGPSSSPVTCPRPTARSPGTRSASPKRTRSSMCCGSHGLAGRSRLARIALGNWIEPRHVVGAERLSPAHMYRWPCVVPLKRQASVAPRSDERHGCGLRLIISLLMCFILLHGLSVVTMLWGGACRCDEACDQAGVCFCRSLQVTILVHIGARALDCINPVFPSRCHSQLVLGFGEEPSWGRGRGCAKL